MTYKKKARVRIKGLTRLITSVFFTAMIFISAVYLSDELSEYAKEGLLLSVSVIIPSVFPFLIITDFSSRYIRFERVGIFRHAFEKLFKINGNVLSAFLCGILCGFPVGARLALTYYENGKISKDECERLMAFANNASPGYVICAVGIGMRGSVSDGVILYLSMVMSSIISGVLFGIKRQKSEFQGLITEQNYVFVNSVKSAAEVCINITGFVTVFGMLAGLCTRFIENDILIATILPFLEIGNAALYLSDLYILESFLTLALTSFSISFSGVCVMCQTLALLPCGNDISYKRCVLIKLTQGIISFAITLLLFFLI